MRIFNVLALYNEYKIIDNIPTKDHSFVLEYLSWINLVKCFNHSV